MLIFYAVLLSLAVQDDPVYKMGESPAVSGLTYTAEKAIWKSYLVSGPLNHPPSAKYLFIKVTVKNDAATPKLVPAFSLTDTAGNRHAVSPQSARLRTFFGTLVTLNPGVTKTGYIVFDVPKSGEYSLVVGGDTGPKIEIKDETQVKADEFREHCEALIAAVEQKKKELLAVEPREWESKSGKFKIIATIGSTQKGKIELLKSDGSKITVEFEKFSKKDQKYIKSRIRKMSEFRKLNRQSAKLKTELRLLDEAKKKSQKDN